MLVLRRDRVAHAHLRAPSAIPVIGAVVLIALMTTKDPDVFERAGSLLLVGLALWTVNWWLHGRRVDPYPTAQLEVVEHRDVV